MFRFCIAIVMFTVLLLITETSHARPGLFGMFRGGDCANGSCGAQSSTVTIEGVHTSHGPAMPADCNAASHHSSTVVTSSEAFYSGPILFGRWRGGDPLFGNGRISSWIENRPRLLPRRR